MSSDALVHWKFLMNTFGRTVEQLAAAKQSRSKYNSHAKPAKRSTCHAHSSTPDAAFGLYVRRRNGLATHVYWTVAVLSSVDAPLAVDSLSLTDVELPD